MPLHLYIYCKLRDPCAGDWLRAAMQSAARMAGVECQLERRVGDPSTWMEVYGPMDRGTAARLTEALDAAFVDNRLETHVEGGWAGRTLEWFQDADDADAAAAAEADTDA